MITKVPETTPRFEARAARERPRVSVCTITYNHERFIGQAIESVMRQDTVFAVEMVIGEDRSTDRTRRIIEAKEQEYPGRIRLRKREHNVGAAANFQDTYLACDGDYIATLDGDDYWTDTQKLQKQVDFLEANPEYAFCFHAVAEVYENEKRSPIYVRPPRRKTTYALSDLSEWIGIKLCSTVFRAGLVEAFPSWFLNAPCGDWPLYVLNGVKGKIGYLDEVMAAHRIHSKGIWTAMRSDRIRALESNIETVEMIIRFLGPSRPAAFRHALRRRFYDLAHAHLAVGAREEARRWVRRAAPRLVYDPRVYRSEPLRFWLRSRMPGLYGILKQGRRAVRRWLSRRVPQRGRAGCRPRSWRGPN